MFKGTSTPTRIQDRYSYIWLLVAGVLFLFFAGRWAIPLAAWFAPLFLLRFVRTQRLLPGLLIAWLVRSAVASIAVQGILPYSGIAYYVVILLFTLVSTLPYWVDRLITPRLRGFIATLVFPLTFTILEYLTAFGPFGVYTSLASTQYGDLPLEQVLSVTGIWGITFLVTWFAAVVNWVWEQGFAWPTVRGGGLLYAGVLSLVLLGGGARLALFPPEATQVRVAGLSASRAAVTRFSQQMPQTTVSLLLSGKASQADRAVARAAFTTIDEDLFARSNQEALAGAKIVIWPEPSPKGASILQEDEPTLMQRASALARQDDIYLDMGLAVFLSNAAGGPPLKDEAILLDPAGKMVWNYEKSHNTPGDQGIIVQGDGKVPQMASPYGRLANVICFDLDFPGMIRQAGQAGVDLLLGPSDDWPALDPTHTQAATFRAIENGFSLVRESSNGLSMAVDYEGHVLAASDYFSTDQQVLVADVPTQGVRTIYAAIGDLFVWLCAIGLAALIGIAIVQSRKHSSEPVAPLPGLQPSH